MDLPLYQVDAFTSTLFGGNPAAVCPLKEWLPDDQLQSIAAENNLSETAFFTRNNGSYHLRWFTPTVEVALCGHATLASAHVICNFVDASARQISFLTKSGELQVTRDGEQYVLHFPSLPAGPCDPPAALVPALGLEPQEIWAARDYMVVYESEDEVRSLVPDFAALAELDRFAVIVTAPGTGDVDFVSRFFAPARGVPEDPVTGSAHCSLIPYWSDNLGKQKLHARQISRRGGELWCEDHGDRVKIAGHAVLFASGVIHLD